MWRSRGRTGCGRNLQTCKAISIVQASDGKDKAWNHDSKPGIPVRWYGSVRIKTFLEIIQQTLNLYRRDERDGTMESSNVFFTAKICV